MSNRIIVSILFIFITMFASNLSYAEAPKESDLGYVPGELLVRFKPKINGQQRNLSEKNQILSSLNAGTIKRGFNKIIPGLTLVKLPAGQTVEDAIKTFGNANEVLYVQPNYILKALSTFPNDPRGPNPDGGQLWGMHNTGQTGGTPGADINAPEAWDIVTDSDIIVAVIDSGVDYNHPDLAANMWINPGEDHPPLAFRNVNNLIMT